MYFVRVALGILITGFTYFRNMRFFSKKINDSDTNDILNSRGQRIAKCSRATPGSIPKLPCAVKGRSRVALSERL